MIPGPVCYWNLGVIVIVRIVPSFRLAGWDLGRKNFPPDAAGDLRDRCPRKRRNDRAVWIYLLVAGFGIMRPQKEVDCGQASPVVPMRGSVIHNFVVDSQRKGCLLYTRSVSNIFIRLNSSSHSDIREY
ncbi:hypothetical protein NPIL_42791 [Nephila pilipes]|uniref:Uncharacterized protein n=1 Tax=Nephila pilipes TaxID=299642 RepID=A0A8X6U070_NEPPI|nr:hypothetical protein NPIL_42791 [Nephila pilipes]